jgi:hypothetical protein
MAITTDEVPYEQLIRFNPDGTVKGMQLQTIKRYFDNGELVAEKISAAIPVAVADNDGLPVNSVVGDLAIAQQKTIDKLTAELEEAKNK